MITKIGLLAAASVAALTTASAPAHAWGFHGGIVRGGYVRPIRPVYYAPAPVVDPYYSASYAGYDYAARPAYVGWHRPYYGYGYHVGRIGVGGYGHWNRGYGGHFRR